MKPRNTPKKPLRIITNFSLPSKVCNIRSTSGVVTNKNLTKSSKQWLNRHINDFFAQKAKTMGYRARSAFKLIEIQEKFHIINPGNRVLDLGCAPGSWSEIAKQFTKHLIIGVDLLPVESLSGTVFIQGDFLNEMVRDDVIKNNNGHKFDVILSDIAPNTTGIKSVDHFRIIDIIEQIIVFAKTNLTQHGSMVIKVFQGPELDDQLIVLRSRFKNVKIFKPESSRKESKEVYVCAIGLRAM